MLPVDAVLPTILTALDTHGAVVVEAPPGSGKTTRVPPALLGGTGEVWVLEPRRVAARAAAARVGASYAMRFDRKVGPENPPRHPVHRKMVDRQQQTSGATGPRIEPHRLQQMPRRRIEPKLGCLSLMADQRVQFSFAKIARLHPPQAGLNPHRAAGITSKVQSLSPFAVWFAETSSLSRSAS